MDATPFHWSRVGFTVLFSVNIRLGFIEISCMQSKVFLLSAQMLVEVVFDILVNMEHTVLQL
jgi:hypothetical protein